MISDARGSRADLRGHGQVLSCESAETSAAAGLALSLGTEVLYELRHDGAVEAVVHCDPEIRRARQVTIEANSQLAGPAPAGPERFRSADEAPNPDRIVQIAIAKRLLSHGADPTTKDAQGFTPLELLDRAIASQQAIVKSAAGHRGVPGWAMDARNRAAELTTARPELQALLRKDALQR